MKKPTSSSSSDDDRAARPSLGGGGRSDRAISVPLMRLFYPDPDPTEGYPDESADIQGYLVAPDQSVTLAATWSTPESLDMLDSVWDALRRKGVGTRRMLLLDDRGRTVSIMTLRPKIPSDLLSLLRSMLVVPIRTSGGFAEIHLFASTSELESLTRRIEGDGGPLPSPSVVRLPGAKDTGILEAEDWAFLGLLNCVGAFDGPAGPTPELVGKLLGIEPEAFSERAAALENGLGGLVTDLFSPPEASGGNVGQAAA